MLVLGVEEGRCEQAAGREDGLVAREQGLVAREDGLVAREQGLVAGSGRQRAVVDGPVCRQ